VVHVLVTRGHRLASLAPEAYENRPHELENLACCLHAEGCMVHACCHHVQETRGCRLSAELAPHARVYHGLPAQADPLGTSLQRQRQVRLQKHDKAYLRIPQLHCVADRQAHTCRPCTCKRMLGAHAVRLSDAASQHKESREEYVTGHF
jgi:hypothetical protein